MDSPADSYRTHDFGNEVGLSVHSTWDGTLAVEAVEDWYRTLQVRAKRTHRGYALAEVDKWTHVKCHATHRLEIDA